MDKWNQSTHSKSGLIDKVKSSHLNEAEVEAQLIEFLKLHVPIRCISDVRQLNLSGSAFHGALDATIGSLFSLPQPGCQHAQRAGQALEAGNCSQV
jgi:hypothetical protein